MPSDIIPPDYVNVPSFYVYSKAVPPVVKETFIQLRGLAWKSKYQETEPHTTAELAEMLGKSSDTIYEHMRILRDASWLLFRKSGYSAYIISFPPPEKQASLFPTNSGSVINKNPPDDKPSINNSGTRGLVNNTPPTNVGNDDKKRDPNLDHPAVILYRGFSRVTANAYQREKIARSVTNIDLWRKTLEHWFGHGWGPMNVIGMLNSYDKGGPAACAACREKHSNGHKPLPVQPSSTDRKKSAVDEALDRLKESANGNHR
jgi:hypothetical protein